MCTECREIWLDRREHEMDEIVIASVAEFQERLQELDSDETGYLFRGQADATWKVHCSAARRLTENSVNPISYRLISPLLVGYLEYVIDRARLLNYFPPDFPKASTDLELLAQLQHQKAATGLIDFTRQPLIALWFACNEQRERDGAVYLLPRSATVEVSSRSYLENNIQFFYKGDTLWSWEPAPVGHRILAQKSVFVFGVPGIGPDKTKRFLVRGENKSEIIQHLEDLCGVNEEELFPDFSGYAVANASDKPFDVKRTISYWQKQIELASGDSAKAKAHYRYGVAFGAIGDAQKAIEQYDAATNLNPRDAMTYVNRGNAKADLGNTDEAIADYDAAIEVNPQCAAAYNNRGNIRAKLDQIVEAIADYDRALELDPQLVEAYTNRGCARADLKLFQEAIADFDKGLEIDPLRPPIYNNRGTAKAELKLFEEAIADFSRVINDLDNALGVSRDLSQAHFNRGLANANFGLIEDALADFKRTVELEPEHADAYYNLGTARTGLGLYKEALSDFDKAILLRPDYAEAYAGRADAKTGLGQYEEALADLERAISLDPQNARAHNGRGVTRASFGHYEEALR